jgi:hypothetical protein
MSILTATRSVFSSFFDNFKPAEKTKEIRETNTAVQVTGDLETEVRDSGTEKSETELTADANISSQAELESRIQDTLSNLEKISPSAHIRIEERYRVMQQIAGDIRDIREYFSTKYNSYTTLAEEISQGLNELLLSEMKKNTSSYRRKFWSRSQDHESYTRLLEELMFSKDELLWVGSHYSTEVKGIVSALGGFGKTGRKWKERASKIDEYVSSIEEKYRQPLNKAEKIQLEFAIDLLKSKKADYAVKSAQKIEDILEKKIALEPNWSYQQLAYA